MKGLLLLFFTVVTVSAIPKPIHQEPKEAAKDNVGQSEKRQLFGRLLNLLERRVLEKKADVPLDLDERWEEGCGHLEVEGAVPVYTEPTGTITSPGWASGSYPNEIGCVWKIQAPEGQFVEVTLEQLYLPEYCSDTVTLHDLSGNWHFTKILGYCYGNGDTYADHPTTSKGNKMGVSFSTDNYGTAKGFKLKWRFVETQPTRSLSDQLVELLKRDD